MIITDEQIKGNWAEQYIASELSSQGCFIRQVTQGHDSGIDLYCETIVNNVPFLHFWCQIKSSKRYKGIHKQITSSQFQKHKEYWLKQPVPVFIFIVPDLRYKQNIPYYIFSALDLLSNKKIKSYPKITNHSELNLFLKKDLIIQTFLWELKDGKVSPLKTENSYIKYFPIGVAQKFEKKLLESLRHTLWRLSEDMLFGNSLNMEILHKKSLTKDDKIQF
ncbi:DUF4365 domain-containing protein [Candidatus Latescibacterota bacterium]